MARWLSFQFTYGTLSCRGCELERAESGRIPKCERDGPLSCPISAGDRPLLPEQVHEVVEIYEMLLHPLAQALPALQTDILKTFRLKHTRAGMVLFYKLIFMYHDVRKGMTTGAAPALPTIPDLPVISKGRMS